MGPDVYLILPKIPPLLISVYDPKTNYLSPRPRFLHYKPNPRIKMYRHGGSGGVRRLDEGFASESSDETGATTMEDELTDDGQEQSQQKSPPSEDGDAATAPAEVPVIPPEEPAPGSPRALTLIPEPAASSPGARVLTPESMAPSPRALAPERGGLAGLAHLRRDVPERADDVRGLRVAVEEHVQVQQPGGDAPDDLGALLPAQLRRRQMAGAAEQVSVEAGGGGGGGKAGRGKNARQITRVLLLKAHRAAGRLTGVASAALIVATAARRRVAAGRTDSDAAPGESTALRARFYGSIRVFLVLSMLLLAVEVAAYIQGWHLEMPGLLAVDGLFAAAYAGWMRVRLQYLAPPLQFLTNACVVLFLIQSVDRLVLCLGCLWIKLKGIKPVPHAGDKADVEAGDEDFPMVLVQMPMCNEREVYQQSIGAVCNLEWPRSNFLVQVLDDSDDATTSALIKEEVEKWQREGVCIVYRHRVIRDGYKAGNLKSAMNCSYVKDYEFVVIFDADFQPQADFLKRAMPHFKGKEDVGLVQARWSFINNDENLLTRLQNINLCFHFEVEQQVNGAFLNFFGFNGTAGVWRIKALEDSGGWMERTTVEDMDIAVRAHLKGWKFLYLNDVECQCELPESYEAYRKQQHRWHSGPMQLFRLCFVDIIKSKIGFWKKCNLIFLFFLLRKLILPFYSFTLFCVILPMTMFVPEAELPAWVVCYIPATMSILSILPAPKSFPFIVPYLLFENTMSVTKFNAMISGLFQLGSAYEWVVTKKSGRSSEGDLVALVEKHSVQQRVGSAPNLDALAKEESHPRKDSKKKKHNRIYRKELALSFLLLTAAARSVLSAQGIHFYFLLFQGVSFLVVGLDLIGEQVE